MRKMSLKMIKLIQYLLQDEPNPQVEPNRDFIQRFVEKRTDYTEQQYEEEKAQFKIDMEKTLKKLKDQDNAKEYIRDIEGLLTGIYDPEPVPVSDEPEPVSEPVSVSKPVSTPEPETCNSVGCLPFITRKNKTKKLVSKPKSKKLKSKMKTPWLFGFNNTRKNNQNSKPKSKSKPKTKTNTIRRMQRGRRRIRGRFWNRRTHRRI